MTPAPDYLEPFVGWRIWTLRSDESLRADAGQAPLESFNGEPWPPGTAVEARCDGLMRSPAHPEPAPATGCGCGIHAFSSRAALMSSLAAEGTARPRLAVGEVALWGRVIVCAHGYRAQYAYPRRLILIPGDGSVGDEVWRRRMAGYGVPVEVAAAADVLPEGWRRSPGLGMRSRVGVRTTMCNVCATPTLTGPGDRCTNPDHDWARHRRWKAELKASGEWTLRLRVRDFFEPPPKKGRRLESAPISVREWIVVFAMLAWPFAATILVGALLG